ncbi:MAG: choice-of-anchor D domain-containing protein [Myxococcaceae bacterium]
MRRFALSFLAACTLSCGDPGVTRVVPELVLPALMLDFGPVPVLNTKTLDVPLLNTGRAPLTVVSVKLKEPSAFSVSSAPEQVATLEPAKIVVAFKPPKEEPYTGTLVVETDDPTNPVFEVALTGVGSTRAVMALEPLELDFGRVAEGTAAVKSFTVKSTGSADLILENIALTDGSSPPFTFVGSTRTPATVKTSLQLTVKYTVAAGATVQATGAVKLNGTDPDQPEVTVNLKGAVNRAPLPAIAPLGNGAPGMVVTLDGSTSSDPDGDTPLTYKWTLRSQPLGAATAIANVNVASTTMTLDPKLPGEYVVELNVTDALGAKNLMPARATIVAAPAEKLLVEMFWNNAETDIDLHLLKTPTSTIGSPTDDCFYFYKKPDWGVAGDAADDPSLNRDALKGYGPEIIGYVDPPGGSTFRVAAKLAQDYGTANKATEVTVRVYVFGVVKGEYKKTLEKKDDVWPVVDIGWPSGALTPVAQQ